MPRSWRPRGNTPAFLVLLASLILPSPSQAALVGITGGRDTNSDPVESVLYELDPTSGHSRIIGSTGLFHVTALAIHPTTGILYAHRNDLGTGIGQLYTIDRTTAATSLVGTTGISAPDITFSSDGTLYGWMELGSTSVFPSEVDDLVTFDLSNGQVTRVGESGVFTNQTGLAFDSGGNLFLKSGDIDASKPQDQRRGQVYQVDPLTGLATATVGLSANPLNELEFDASGRALTIARSGQQSILQMIDLDVASAGYGNVTDLQTFDIRGITSIVSVTAVPEPSSVLMLTLAGLGMLAISRCRRRPLSRVRV